MEQLTFDEMVLQWVESHRGIPQKACCRTLQRTCAFLARQPNDIRAAAAKARGESLLQIIEAAPDPAALRQAALSLAEGCSSANMEEQLLAPCCTLILRCGHRMVQRITTAPAVAAALATQNLAAASRWSRAGDPQIWALAANTARNFGVRRVFMLDGEGATVSFHDEVAFDLCSRIERVERTLLLVDRLSDEDGVRAALQFGLPRDS